MSQKYPNTTRRSKKCVHLCCLCQRWNKQITMCLLLKFVRKWIPTTTTPHSLKEKKSELQNVSFVWFNWFRCFKLMIIFLLSSFFSSLQPSLCFLFQNLMTRTICEWMQRHNKIIQPWHVKLILAVKWGQTFRFFWHVGEFRLVQKVLPQDENILYYVLIQHMLKIPQK